MSPTPPGASSPAHPAAHGAARPAAGAGAGRARRYRTARTVVALMLREMATTYGRSPGGYLWEILEPVLALALLTTIFSFFLSVPPVGVNFALFYATGYLPFVMFNDVANKMATAINFSRPLLAYPAVTFIDALLARFVLQVLTHLMVGYIIFAGILILYDTRSDPDLPFVILAFAMAGALGLGVGTLNCYLMTAFPVWERAWMIVTRPLFIVSGVFFVYEQLPQIARDILWFNPLVHVVGMMRHGFYATYHAPYVSVVFVAAVAGGTMAFGLLLLWRHHKTLLEG